MIWLALLAGSWLCLIVGWGWRLRTTLLQLWREPCFSRPILILESDDWAPAPGVQETALVRLLDLLDGFRDRLNHPPVMTLGLVLSAPVMEQKQLTIRQFDDSAAGPILALIQRGINAGLFTPQLHGAAHYWPAAFADWLAQTPAAQNWCADANGLRSETLPSALQSRWWNPQLDPPAAPDAEAASSAAQAEAKMFTACFGQSPRVAVPPTFLWQDAVETGWRQGGVRYVVTPGRRWQARDCEGRLQGAGPALRNGQSSPQGLTYLVRDCYFEPERGHSAEDGLVALTQQNRLARPTLLEIHRSNFIADAALCERSLHELRRLLEQALAHHAELRFLSTAELAERLTAQDGNWIIRSPLPRLKFFFRRGMVEPSLQRWFKLSGLFLLARSW